MRAPRVLRRRPPGVAGTPGRGQPRRRATGRAGLATLERLSVAGEDDGRRGRRRPRRPPPPPPPPRPAGGPGRGRAWRPHRRRRDGRPRRGAPGPPHPGRGAAWPPAPPGVAGPARARGLGRDRLKAPAGGVLENFRGGFLEPYRDANGSPRRNCGVLFLEPVLLRE